MPSFTEGLNLVKETIDGAESANYSERTEIAVDVAATDFSQDPFDKNGWKHTESLTSLGICQVNQIGTATVAIEAVKLAKNARVVTRLTTHKCGETENSFEAGLAVGLSTSQIT
ncbi:hypothetical protein C5167_000941 [Papaver somniferum]|uniref:phosphopyruvate hydratase n=1 Tax=Papaver somniferum TaxID=3469 RepID=A0A4Y7KXT5_PAPSO|nr:hypothetical protein C5167_000941 [Papaver somniferum]